MSSFAYDVCNELVLDSIIERKNSSEPELAVRHLSKLNPETDILVFDRGYPSLWLFGLLKEKGFKFCFRLNSLWKDGVNLKDSLENDIDWAAKDPSKNTLKKVKEYGLPNKIDGLRLVTIKLSSGETEVLAVNLTDRDKYGVNDLKELYHLRWGVEEGYKSFKRVLCIEYFTGKTVLAIKQDYYARVCMMNMASMLKSQGLYEKGKELERKGQKVQPNKTQVLAKVKDFFIDLFNSNKTAKCLKAMLRILQKCFDIVRPDRSFPRHEMKTRRRHKIVNSRGI